MITSCAWAPPSDQVLNCQVFFDLICGEGAESEFRDPWITVRVNGLVACVPFSASANPVGLELSVRVTVFGSSRIDRSSVSPPESVAVSRSSRWEGYSWSGVLNEPPATPLKDCSEWAWQFDGQWCRIRLQDSAEAGSG